MQQMAPASNRFVCNEVQQIALVCVISSRLPSLDSGCTQSAMGVPGPIYLLSNSHSRQSGGKTEKLPLQEDHPDFSGVAQYALCFGT